MTAEHYSIALACCGLVLAGVQLIKVHYLSRTHFGVLSAAALRWQLRLWQWQRKRCAVIAIDVRKMHDGNEVFGYSTMNEFVAELVCCRLRPGRTRDLVGQWSGGDEFIIGLEDSALAPIVVERLQAKMREITAAMPAHQRQALYDRTGGLVDGLHAAIVVVPETTRAYTAAERAIDAAGPLKAGQVTGNRSTSGKAGTLVEVLTGERGRVFVV